MKAIFPNTKSLQPIPTPSVHPNISENMNSTSVSSGGIPTENTVGSTNNTTNAPVLENIKSSNIWVFYFVGLLIILIVIITYEKLKRK